MNPNPKKATDLTANYVYTELLRGNANKTANGKLIAPLMIILFIPFPTSREFILSHDTPNILL